MGGGSGDVVDGDAVRGFRIQNYRRNDYSVMPKSCAYVAYVEPRLASLLDLDTASAPSIVFKDISLKNAYTLIITLSDIIRFCGSLYRSAPSPHLASVCS